MTTLALPSSCLHASDALTASSVRYAHSQPDMGPGFSKSSFADDALSTFRRDLQAIQVQLVKWLFDPSLLVDDDSVAPSHETLSTAITLVSMFQQGADVPFELPFESITVAPDGEILITWAWRDRGATYSVSGREIELRLFQGNRLVFRRSF